MSAENPTVSGNARGGGGTSDVSEGSGWAKFFRGSHASTTVDVTDVATINSTATKTLSAMRIMFGVVFLFDGILKWILFATGQMQGVIQGSNMFGFAWLNDNWLAVGTLVAIGETAGGLLLIAGIFQRPAAVWSAVIMLGIWAFGGFGGVYTSSGGWSFSGYTDPGGDLMLALVFLVLIFAPYAYGLASRWHLRDRFKGSTARDRVLRFIVT